MTTTLQAPAKLTLSLRVTGIRDDGLHLIDAEMVTLSICDELHISETDESTGSSLVVRSGGDNILADDIPTDESNLVMKALRLADKTAEVVLTKRIPSQAGLGGGSSDAGAVLRWSGFTDLEAAAQLGADIAFCTVGGRARVSGIGEHVEPLPFVKMQFTLFTPPVQCPTGAIYQRWDELGGPRGDNGNDLEPAALSVVSELAQFRDEFGERTGQTPRLAGSGSTWFVEGNHPGEGHVTCETTPAT